MSLYLVPRSQRVVKHAKYPAEASVKLSEYCGPAISLKKITIPCTLQPNGNWIISNDSEFFLNQREHQ